MTTTQPAIPVVPAGVSALISGAVKAVLIAIAALGLIPLDGEAIAAVTLAVAAIVDVALYFGLLRPKVVELEQQAAGQLPAGHHDTQPYQSGSRTTFRDSDLR